MIIIADNNKIKRIILDDLIEGVGSDLKPKSLFKLCKRFISVLHIKLLELLD